MKLKDALLCIDCDEVFSVGESGCNPRCPSCSSSVFAPLANWVQTWVAFEKVDGGSRVAPYGTSTKKRRMEIVRPTPIAA
jgi:hypothetical protein